MNQQVEVNLADVVLSTRGRTKGRPKGKVNKTIGLLKKKHVNKEEHKSKKRELQKTTSEDTLLRKKFGGIPNIKLSKQPGSDNWTSV